MYSDGDDAILMAHLHRSELMPLWVVFLIAIIVTIVIVALVARFGPKGGSGHGPSNGPSNSAIDVWMTMNRFMQ